MFIARKIKEDNIYILSYWVFHEKGTSATCAHKG